ncbi:MAG: succinate dehydrogenase cytochrome b subunit [Thermoanaerobaculia bacterium]|nr:succinate dehydrogenase cytochrome b subunit [Thermoanaerobaculia bacterium]
MGWILDLYRSAVFKKYVMAVTGMMLFGFVLSHMTGNLKAYAGPEEFNHYAEGLRELGKPIFGHGQFLWVMRTGLLIAVGLHIWSAFALSKHNREARPERYVRERHQKSTYASRTMIWGGVIVLLFVVYHLLHLTFGTVHADFIPGDVYHNFVVGFQSPVISGFYILANVALGFHLYHGLWSMFQSLGWNGSRFNDLRKKFAVAFALVISVANISFPIAVLTGAIG